MFNYKVLFKKTPLFPIGSSGFANFWNDFNIKNDVERDLAIKKIIDKAFDSGINYFDTAPWYGDSESYLGKALTGRPRNTYYIATKVGRYNSERPFNEWFDFSYDRTIKSVENSLKALNIDYIDLIQVK
jgi:aryl-alcohol dehydrogenase-like predicted oxidoreductase